MGRLDWDRARRDRLVADRGGEPICDPGSPPSWARHTPAPARDQNAAIERWINEFKRLPYAQQLSYLTTVRRGLTRLTGSDDLAADAIRLRFKPLLKTRPGRAAAPKPVAAKTSVASAAAAILELVARRPDELTQKQCVALLAGDATDARGDKSFGLLAAAAKTTIREAARALRSQGRIADGPKGRLRIGSATARATSNVPQRARTTRPTRSRTGPVVTPAAGKSDPRPAGVIFQRFAGRSTSRCVACRVIADRPAAYVRADDPGANRPICPGCFRAGKRWN